MDKPFRRLRTILFLVVCVIATANSANYTSSRNLDLSNCNGTSTFSDRLAGLDLALSTNACDAHLQRKLKDYLAGGIHSTERMLGRANQYFPIFEYYLAKHNMPESLKYLAVAESMLVPGAVSAARAAGLWQLMPATAREMGLRVDRVVDERLDLYRSTEAAVIMLKDLYRQFGDWHLALAAYNCGPGRVRRAVRRAQGHTHYPKVKRYLPGETQRYVAAYVAAAYTLNYYNDYGLTPAEYLREDDVASLTIVNTTRLRDIAQDCDVDLAVLRKMNPAFVRGYVPRSRKGYRLRVPYEHKWAVQQYVWGRPNLVEINRADDLDLAWDFAAQRAYDPNAFFLGCRSERLTYTPVIAHQTRLEDLTLNYYATYQAVAMN